MKGALEAFRGGLEAGDSELTALRNQAEAKGWTFPLDQVVRAYQLDPVETQLLELSLMPQLDLAFRKRMARFNNNILLDFVDVDAALSLLFPDRVDKLQARSYFATEAPLVKHGLVRLERPKDPKGEGLLALEITPPDRLADFLLCRRSVDQKLRLFTELSHPATELSSVALEAPDREELEALIRHFKRPAGISPGQYSQGPFSMRKGLCVAFIGPSGTGKTMLAEALAASLESPMLRVDCATLAGVSRDFTTLLVDLFTEARTQGAVLLLDRCETLFAKQSPKLPALLAQLELDTGLTVLTSNRPDEVDSGVERYVGFQLKLGMPDVELRHQVWSQHLPTGLPVHPDVDLSDLSSRYELTGGQISRACELAEQRVVSSESADVALTQELLKHCAQAQIRANMDDLSVRSRLNLTLDSLILPEREMSMVQEVLRACRNRIFVMSKWGFGKRLATGKGINVLFKGEPGTGKTLCAEILASELGMKLYHVSIPNIVSKYVGETEKNLAKIFASARANHCMLLFDEADSLFGKRVDVQNSIDRFSNMETNLLLQEIERFEGVVILTTNLDKNMDDAFSRRIMFKIDFPKPNAEGRALIWKTHFPKDCPLADDVDYEELGDSFELSGGHIKNAVLRAAYRAAERGDKISYDDILRAAEMECINSGKLFRSPTSLDDW